MNNVKTALLLSEPGSRNSGVPGHRNLWVDQDVEGYGPPINSPEYTDEVEKGSAVECVRRLPRRKGTLIALAIVGALAGVLLTLSQSPVYQARTSIEIQDLNQEFLNMKAVNPVDDSSHANALTDLQTQLQILQSESLIGRTLDKLHISSLSALNPQTVGMAKWRREPVDPTRTQLMEAAARNLQVSVTGQTRILEVSFQSTDPKNASGFAN